MGARVLGHTPVLGSAAHSSPSPNCDAGLESLTWSLVLVLVLLLALVLPLRLVTVAPHLA